MHATVRWHPTLIRDVDWADTERDSEGATAKRGRFPRRAGLRIPHSHSHIVLSNRHPARCCRGRQASHRARLPGMPSGPNLLQGSTQARSLPLCGYISSSIRPHHLTLGSPDRTEDTAVVWWMHQGSIPRFKITVTVHSYFLTPPISGTPHSSSSVKLQRINPAKMFQVFPSYILATIFSLQRAPVCAAAA